MKSVLSDFGDKLREKGYKLTLQRIAIYEALQEGENHATAEEVHAQVSIKYPMIGLSTVYNTLETLCDIGLIRKMTIDAGIARYDVIVQPHAHLVCLGCGEIREYEAPYCEPCRESVIENFKFKVVRTEATFFGYCSRCQKMKNEMKKTS
jgi:Fe2+ or Zn2+ uptake regulation protein